MQAGEATNRMTIQLTSEQRAQINDSFAREISELALLFEDYRALSESLLACVHGGLTGDSDVVIVRKRS